MPSPWKNIANLSCGEIRSLQNNKLYDFINTHLYPFSPYYQQLFDQHKIDPKKIKTVKDLQYIPLTSKADFVSESNPSERFKDFILQPDQDKIRKHWSKTKLLSLALQKIIRGKSYLQQRLSQEYRPIFMTFTTGTTHTPVPYLYTDYDIKNLYLSGARMLHLFGIQEGEPIVNMFPYAPHLAFWQVVFGGLSSGRLILSTGGGKVMGTEGNIAAILRMKPSVLLGVPSYVYHVLRIAKEKGCQFDFIKKVVLGASRVTQSFKLRLVHLLQEMGAEQVSILGTYGFTEARCAWAEYPTQPDTSSGYYLYPDKEIFEVVDPKTGEVKGEGEDGELVYTSLDARGSIVFRYRTGDFVKGGITYEPCPYTKMTVPRISSDITRLSDVKDLKLSKIKGSLVNLNHFATILGDLDSITEWQIEIRKKDNDPFEVDQLAVYLCVKDGVNCTQLAEDLKKDICLKTEIAPNEVTFLSFEEMVKRLELETASKEKRIIDRRPS